MNSNVNQPVETGSIPYTILGTKKLHFSPDILATGIPMNALEPFIHDE